MGFVREFFVRRQLKSDGFKGERYSVALSRVKRCIILFDVLDAEFGKCTEIAEDFFRSHGIELKAFYLDMGKHGKDDIITTGVKTTILKRNLNIFGILPQEMIEELVSDPADIYICAANNTLPVTRCVNGIVPAPFCVGLADYPGSPFFMVFGNSDEDNIQVNFHNSAERLENILRYLEMVV